MGRMTIIHPIYEAGAYLARRGREECQVCIAGLRQTATAFGQLWAPCAELEQILEDQRPRDTIGTSVSMALGEVHAALQMDPQQQQNLSTPVPAPMSAPELDGLDFGASLNGVSVLWSTPNQKLIGQDSHLAMPPPDAPPPGLPYAVAGWLREE